MVFFSQLLREKVFLPEVSTVTKAELSEALLGEEGGNLRYIRELTGVMLILRGQGTSGPHKLNEEQEPLHFYIEWV